VASKLVMFRATDKFIRQATRAAEKAGESLSGWIRKLIEREIGVSAELPQGTAALSPRARKKLSKAGADSRWGVAEKKPNKKAAKCSPKNK
jgi:hypothetical protein